MHIDPTQKAIPATPAETAPSLRGAQGCLARGLIVAIAFSGALGLGIQASSGSLASAGGNLAGDWAVGGINAGEAWQDGILLEWGPLAGSVLVELPPVGVHARRAPAYLRRGRLMRFDTEVELRVLDARGAVLHSAVSRDLDLAKLPSGTVLVQATGIESRTTKTFRISNLNSGK